jgi:hypothetical protein
MKRRTDRSSPDSAQDDRSQLERFRAAARELGTDESEEAFDRALRKVASAPPAPMHKPKKKPKPSKERR